MFISSLHQFCVSFQLPSLSPMYIADLSRQRTDFSLRLPHGWKQNISSEEDRNWFGRALFVAKGKLTCNLKHFCLLEAICFHLCSESQEGPPVWEVEYSTHQGGSYALNSQTLFKGTNMVLFTINETTLVKWYKNSTRRNEIEITVSRIISSVYLVYVWVLSKFLFTESMRSRIHVCFLFIYSYLHLGQIWYLITF